MIQFLAIVMTLLGTHARSQEPRDTPTFSVSVNLVKIPISIIDPKGASILDVRREDFVLYEDGVQQQIRSFGIDRNPVSVVLVLDTSATVEAEEKRMKESAESFAEALGSDDRISIITFADEITLLQDWTSGPRPVRKALRKIKPGLRTALYDAMYSAAHDQLAGVDGRKAIILLTDCLNNQSSFGFLDASLAIVQSQASLYVVSKTVIVRQAARLQRRVVMLEDIYKHLFGDDNDYVEEFFQKRETEMIDLAEKTGGRCFFPSDYDQIKGVYNEVARELNSQLFMTYISNQNKAPNSYHSITVDYLQPSSKLIYRKGYYYEPRPLRRRLLP
jgi:VWFA-related protein